MNTLQLALQGAWKVLSAGLVFGVGMPVVYALGIRALTTGATVTVDDDGTKHIHATTFGRIAMALLMVVIVGVIAIGITIIVAGGIGKAVSFEHIIPMIVDKKK